MTDLSPDLSPEKEDERPASAWAKAKDAVLELLHIIVVSLAIIVPVRYFLIQPFYVNGASMEPNFHDKEYLIIDELTYRFDDPRRGDIIVFRYPNDPKQHFIKRVIGLPGERVVVAGGKVRIFDRANPQGAILDESSYLDTSATGGDRDVTLGDGEYFLMGDNRAASLDSRIFGPVPRQYITGRVLLRGWPPQRFQIFTRPAAVPDGSPPAEF